AVIFGRRTYFSIPERYRPLPGRLNIVLTRGSYDFPDDVLVAGSLDEALECAADCAVAWVCGGAHVYAEAFRRPDLSLVDLTRIEASYDCDVRLPLVPARFVQSQCSDVLNE